MSALTKFGPYNMGSRMSRGEYNRLLELAANSDSRIRKIVADNINLRNGIITAVTNFSAPITKTIESTAKESIIKADALALIKEEADKKRHEKTTIQREDLAEQSRLKAEQIHEESAAQRFQLAEENLRKMEEINRLQEKYMTNLLNDQTQTLSTDSRTIIERLETINKDQDRLLNSIRLQGQMSRGNEEELIRYSRMQTELLKELKKGGIPTTRIRQLAEMTETQQELIKELPFPEVSDEPHPLEVVTTEKAPAYGDPSTSHAAGTSESDEAATRSNEMKIRLTNYIQQYQPDYTPGNVKDPITRGRLIAYGFKTGIFLSEIDHKGKKEKALRAALSNPTNDKIASTIGFGLNLNQKPLEESQRLQLLLASHQAGNSGGMEEFMNILKKLLKKKTITKKDYLAFTKKWTS